MEKIKMLARYYYIGLVIGYFNKKDILNWTDRMIEENEYFPYEMIEITLSGNKPAADIASRLKQIYQGELPQDALYQLLGEIVNDFELERMTAEEFFAYLSRLYDQDSEIILDEDLSNALNRLDDAYYLAAEGRYGDVETVCKEAVEELDPYKAYIGRIKE